MYEERSNVGGYAIEAAILVLVVVKVVVVVAVVVKVLVYSNAASKQL